MTRGEGDGLQVGSELFQPDSVEGNLFRNNDFRFHDGTDCVDFADPTDNSWTNNLGESQNQDGLCAAPI